MGRRWHADLPDAAAGALRRRTGAQQYSFQVPAGVRYAWVIIWCDPFNVGMAEAAIPATP